MKTSNASAAGMWLMMEVDYWKSEVLFLIFFCCRFQGKGQVISVIFGCMLLITKTESQSDSSTEQTTQTTTTTQAEPTTTQHEPITTTQLEPTTTQPEPTTTTQSEPTTTQPEPTTTQPEPTTTTQPESTTTQPEPTTTQPEPTTTTQPEPTTTTQPESTTTQPEPTTTQPEPTTTTQPEPTTTQPEPTTTQSEPTTTQPEPTTTQPEPTTTQPEPTTTQPEPTSTETTYQVSTAPDCNCSLYPPTTIRSTQQSTKPKAAQTNQATATSTNKTTSAPTNKTSSTPTNKTTSAPINKSSPTPTNKSTSTPTNKATSTNKPTSTPSKKTTSGPANMSIPAPSSNKHSNCYDLCSTTTDTTTSISSTPVIITTTIRQRSVNLNGKTVEVDLVVIMKGNFTAVVPKNNSPEYDNFTRQFNESLTDFYQHILGNMFKRIAINGFSEGSIKCNYTVEMAAPTNKTEANALFKDLKEANWTLLNTTEIGAVLEDETRDEQTKTLVNVNIILSNNLCRKQEVFRFDSNNNGYGNCVYKCDINKTDCGSHGYCVVTYTGDVKCLCKDDNNNTYHGDSCKERVPVHGPTTVKTVVVTESLSRTDIIAIAAGTGGGLVLLLLISLVCVCRRLQSAKKRNKFYNYMGNDKEALHSENSRIENVPNLKNDHTNMAYLRDTDYMQLQHFEPEGKNVDYETGQHQGYERDEKSYRKVEAPEVGNVTIYQPSHLKEPIDRQSGASKIDREEVQSYPFHTMDTEKSYKIRRPTVNSDTSIPYN